MSRLKEMTIGYPVNPDEVEAAYFQWLCQFGHLDIDYLILASILHRIEFTWYIPNDDNRDADGRKLREIFTDETDIDCSSLDGPASILEMLLALAIRMEYILDDVENHDRIDLFWEMLGNLGVDTFTDDEYYYLGGDDEVINRVRIFTERQYTGAGKGGLFPLRYPHIDQRTVEIWYQMSAYLLENYPID